MNNLIFIVSILFFLGSVLLLFKIFGKAGLYVFTVFATILSNIQVCKCVDLFGVSSTAGNVLYAASFLVTDILSERYGKKAAGKAVKYGLVVTILWVLGTQITLLFEPNSNDYVNDSLNVVFGLVPRVALASFIGYACSQSLDVFLYHFIWNKTGNNGKKLWIRNNLSTLTSQAVDTLVFTTLAFWGTYPTDVFISILLTTYLFKAVVALLDTPFMYLARAIKPIDETRDQAKSADKA